MSVTLNTHHVHHDDTSTNHFYLIDTLTIIDSVQIHLHHHPYTLVMTIRGDIEKKNVDRITAYVHHRLSQGQSLVLDLTELTSFPPEAIWLLCAIDADYRHRQENWVLVGSRVVLNLLNDFHNHAYFPIAVSRDHALQALSTKLSSDEQSMSLVISDNYVS